MPPALDTPTTPSPHHARELDERLQHLCALPHADHPEACRLFYEMSQGAFRALGFRSFSRYLRDRRIPLSWAHLRRKIHEKLVVELDLPPASFRDVPLSKLRHALPVLTVDNAEALPEAARTLPPAAFRRRLAEYTAPSHRTAPTWMRPRLPPGTYRLVPVPHQPCTRPATCHTVSVTVYAAGDAVGNAAGDDWFIDLPATGAPAS